VYWNLLTKKKYVGGIICDLAKAFDFANHEIFVAKLHFYGIWGVSEDCFMSFLTDRRQKVEVKSPNTAEFFFFFFLCVTGVHWNMGFPKDQF
jgi:hypothetical protein